MTCPANWLWLCISLALGEACGFALSKVASLWPVAVAIGLAVSLAFCAYGARGTRFVVTFFAGLSLALFAANTRNAAIEEATWRNSGTPFTRVFRVKGDAKSFPEKKGVMWTSFPAVADSIKVRVIYPRRRGEPIPKRGEEWQCAGWLERMKEDEPGRLRKLWVKGKKTYVRRIESKRGRFSAWLVDLRAELSRRMGIGLDESPDAADLNRAILLGERTRLSRSDRNAFVAAGTIHIFAISGLHVMLVAHCIFIALMFVRCPLRFAGLLLVPALWLYVAMTGFAPSAVRAAAMASLQYLAPLFWRKPDGLVAWSMTFFFVYATDPTKVYDVGCALSFAVMLGIVFWGRFTTEFVKNQIVSSIVMTIAIWAVGAPIAAHAFGRVTPGGMLANLALIPAAGISVKAALAGLFTSIFSDRIAAHVNNFAALVANGMSGLSRAVAQIPGANFEVTPWSIPACVAWYALLVLALVLLRAYLTQRRRRL